MAKINLTEALAKVLKKIVEEGAYPSPYHPLILQRSPSRAPSWEPDVMEPEIEPGIDVEPEVEPEEENPLAPPDEDVKERPKARHYRGIKETDQAWAKKIADKLNGGK